VTPKPRSAGVVVVRPTEPGWRYLLLRAFRNWDFPKGIVDPDEAPLEAALREVREESSLGALELRWGEVFRETEPYAGGKVARYYVASSAGGDVRLPVSPELGRPEHHEYRWASSAEARRLLPPRLLPILDWASGLVEGSG
jgi:bis(5'-nucleosidyl)-tetraphosphatase